MAIASTHQASMEPNEGMKLVLQSQALTRFWMDFGHFYLFQLAGVYSIALRSKYGLGCDATNMGSFQGDFFSAPSCVFNTGLKRNRQKIGNIANTPSQFLAPWHLVSNFFSSQKNVTESQKCLNDLT